MPHTRKQIYGRAAAATSQPLATTAGLQILEQGGNAAEAAVAIAATLAVTEPCSNGIGGDLFALHYEASTQKITAVHGNGSAPQALTPALFGPAPVPISSPHTVTVPGAVAGWVDLVDRFGSGDFPLKLLLAPAVRHAEEGFPVAPLTADAWQAAESLLFSASNGTDFLIRNSGTTLGWRAPHAGELFRNRGLADTLREIGVCGKSGFYRGKVAEAIVGCLQELGGVMTMEDLSAHETEFREPVKVGFRDFEVFETGPPSHGVVALAALGVLDGWAAGELDEDVATHVMVEGLRLAFRDAGNVVGDPGCGGDAAVSMVQDEYVKRLREGISMDRRGVVKWGSGMRGGGTVQFCVVDRQGNAVSMVQSNYQGFGTGHVPSGTGFSLHNRGLNFECGEGSINSVKGGRKPYHTIIPGMIKRKDGRLFAAFGVMGGFMQPQGHLQIVRRLIDFQDSAQEALDYPRFRATGPFSKVEDLGEEEILVEEGVDEDVVEGLKRRGHIVRIENRQLFGRGQVCVVMENGVVEAGSDNRADGCAGVL